MRDHPIADLYNATIRRHLPRRLALWNDVAVHHRHLLDSHLMPRDDIEPDYEDAFISPLRTHVAPDDTVCVVGGGFGVSSVVAARHAEQVHTFEAGDEHVRHCREAAALNGVSDSVTVHHAVVGDAIAPFSDASEAEHLEPDDLPECDVLALDCEGAELDILDGLDRQPRVIIVETHGRYDAPETAVRERLNDLGYSVARRGVEDARLGVFVLTAVDESAGQQTVDVRGEPV